MNTLSHFLFLESLLETRTTVKIVSLLVEGQLS